MSNEQWEDFGREMLTKGAEGVRGGKAGQLNAAGLGEWAVQGSGR
jgi:hypothetical protein